jgi:aspartyl-tRNA(Asn)/glutamyl-tRNA(Gln) amidotransferase subunit A
MSAEINLSVAHLQSNFQDRSLDPVDLVERLLVRIQNIEPTLHAFITVSGERALADARASRERWRAGAPRGPLDGVPIAIKDNVAVAGLPWTAGSAALRKRIASSDAPAAARLSAAGTVLLGKLNMHEGALGATTDNEAFGRCINPLHNGHSPGGSSGGSGAALAADLCSIAVGSDTMGSIRVPASYCGVFGYKPGNDTVSSEGIVPLCHVLDVAGPLALNATDCAVSARVMMGLSPALANRQTQTDSAWRGLRIGIPRQLDSIPLHPEVAEGFQRFIATLEKSGATLQSIDLSSWDPTRARLAGLLAGEADALAWWRSEIGHDLPGVSTAFGAMLRYSERAGAAKVAAARSLLQELRDSAPKAFTGVDLIALPTTPHASFAHTATPPIDQADLTALANFYGCGAWAIPIEAQGRAVSVQLMAAPGADELLLNLAPALDKLGPKSSRFRHALVL